MPRIFANHHNASEACEENTNDKDNDATATEVKGEEKAAPLSPPKLKLGLKDLEKNTRLERKEKKASQDAEENSKPRRASRVRSAPVKFVDMNLDFERELCYVLKMTGEWDIPTKKDPELTEASGEEITFSDTLHEVEGGLTLESIKVNNKQKKLSESINDKFAKKRRSKDGPKAKVTGIKKEKKPRKKKDPNAPKGPKSSKTTTTITIKSSFMYFSMEKKLSMKTSGDLVSFADSAKIVGAAWKSLADKSKYEELAARDKVRYQKDMVVYRDYLAEMEDDSSEDEETETINASSSSFVKNHSATSTGFALAPVLKSSDDDDDDDENLAASNNNENNNQEEKSNATVMSDDDDNSGSEIGAISPTYLSTKNSDLLLKQPPDVTSTAASNDEKKDKHHAPGTPSFTPTIEKKVSFDSSATVKLALTTKLKSSNTQTSQFAKNAVSAKRKQLTELNAEQNAVVDKPPMTPAEPNKKKQKPSKHAGFKVPTAVVAGTSNKSVDKKKKKFLPPVKSS